MDDDACREHGKRAVEQQAPTVPRGLEHREVPNEDSLAGAVALVVASDARAALAAGARVARDETAHTEFIADAHPCNAITDQLVGREQVIVRPLVRCEARPGLRI